MVVLPHGGIARDEGVACDEYLRMTSLRPGAAMPPDAGEPG